MNNITKKDFEYILEDKNINWEVFSGKSVLITGANGFLPSYMLQTLLYLNHKEIYEPIQVIGLVRNLVKARKKFANYLEDKNLILIEHDISNPYSTNMNIDYIVHAASQASPKYFFSDPVGTINANSLGTTNMLKLAKEKNVESFLYFSTGEVCGDIFERKTIVTENDYGIIDPLNIRNCYSESKRMGENMCACWHHQYGVPAKIIRPSHTYGPGFSFDDGRAFTSFVASVVRGENIILKSDGSAKRSFCYLADATRAYFKVLLDGENANAYNVSNDYEISILELANILSKLSPNKNSKVEFDKNIQMNDSNINPSSKISHGLMDNKKMKSLGWGPIIKEEEGFKRTITSFLENKNEQFVKIKN